MSGTDWTTVDADVAREIARHGESRINTSLAIAIAADQRAMTFSGIMATASMGVLAAAIASASGSDILPGFAAPGFVAALGFWVSCTLSILQARPSEFVPAPNHPRNLYGSEEYLAGPLSQCLGWDAEGYQHAIDINEACLRKNGRLMMAAILVALATPVVSLISWGAWEAGAELVAWAGRLLGFLSL